MIMVETARQQTTELLIVKAGDDYIRFVEDDFQRCGMNKGSVFPLAQLEEVQAKCRKLLVGESFVRLMKLTIIEEPFMEL
jgi:hypothetical protein